ncbi:hypothetical protein IFR04_011338 [Cadophora malorum]|uniref:Uncharacterized protein n=1 Tax=Cadophora malorum TaxID=108018 RepID=A0A8H7W2N4_9HELO|nr:hypothetical protein IFR04_011338 [Cadophora malorum]
MALPIINRIWSESPYLMNGNEHVASNYYESVHESQIGIAIFDILHLDVRDSAGSVLSTEGRECINTTRLIVTGGTDDPSVKLSLSPSDEPHYHLDASAIEEDLVFKFGAFVSDKVDSAFQDRQVHDFHPKEPMKAAEQGLVFLGPTDFSNSLYDLRWENAEVEGERMTGLQAFWRLRILHDVTQGSIPLDICEKYPYWCDTVHKTEAVLSYVGPETQRRPRNAPHDLAYEVIGIVFPPAEFSSNAEAEFYLKGALLYEEHIVSEIRKRFLDGKQIYHYWTEPLPRRSDRPNTTDWLMFVTLDIGYASETAKLPEIGGQVVITWINSARDVYVTDDCLVIGANWEFIEADLTIKKRCKVALIVGQRYGDAAIYHYEREGYLPVFEFSRQSPNVAFIVGAIDKLLFETERRVEGPIHEIKSALMMGKHGARRVSRTPSVWNEHIVEAAMLKCSSSQKIVFRDLLGSSALSIVRGPPSSGKSLLAAILTIVYLKSMERVLIVTKSRSAAKKLFDEAVATAKQLGVLSSLLAGIATFLSSETPSVQLGTTLFTTLDELQDPSIHAFAPTVLIVDQAEQINDHWLFAMCGLFSSSLTRISLFGDEQGVIPKSRAGERNHFRWQFERSTSKRLMDGGYPVLLLSEQRHIDFDLARLPFLIGYRMHQQPSDSGKLKVRSAEDVRCLPERRTMLTWVAKFLGKSIESCKVSIFVNVKDGNCMTLRNSSTCLNHQNMAMVLRILSSLSDHGIAHEDIIILSYFEFAVPILRRFYHSRGFRCAVEHVASQQVKARDYLVSIIDSVQTYKSKRNYVYGPSYPERSFPMATTLMIAKSLRIIVGYGNEKEDKWVKRDYWGRVFVWHHRRGLVKDVEIEDGILEFEEELRPGMYYMDPVEKEISGTVMYARLREKSRDAKYLIDDVYETVLH